MTNIEWADETDAEYRIVWTNHNGQHEELIGNLDVEGWQLMLRLMQQHPKFIDATLQVRADAHSPWYDAGSHGK
jgi:hypothetical protein